MTPAQTKPATGPLRKKAPRPAGLAQDDALIKMCKEFTSNAVAESNIVMEADFERFMPLFNKQLLEATPDADVNKLATEYQNKFSLQHPIKIISMELDEKNGVVYPGDRRRHKVVLTIPPMFRTIKTLNQCGKGAHNLVTAFFNAVRTRSGNPLDHRDAMYSQKMADALKEGNSKDPNRDRQRKEFAESEKAILAQKQGGKQAESDQPKEQEPVEEPSGTSMFDWDD